MGCGSQTGTHKASEMGHSCSVKPRGNETNGVFRPRVMLWACGILGEVLRIVCGPPV